MKLGELRETVIENIVRDDLLPERVDRYINNTISRIARYHNWRDLYVKASLNTSKGESQYHLPLGDDKLKDLVSATLSDGTQKGNRLKFIPFRRFHDIIPNPETEQEGKPAHYMLWDNVIELFPIPSDTFLINILYSKWPSKITSEEYPEIKGIDDLIIAGATSQAFMSYQEVEMAGAWQQQFNLFLQEAIKADLAHTDHEMKLQGYRSASNLSQGQDPRLIDQ